MSSQKIIAVTGATGLQGGSVAKFLLEDGSFAVRAITRNPESAAAKELAAQGAEVVKADSREVATLVKAFEGAYGVFALTNFWEPGVGAKGEVEQGKLLVDAAKTAGVKHFVWSTLDRSEFKADHWESKADVDDYLKASGVPRTSLYTAFYFENIIGMSPLRKRTDGSYDYPMPLITDAPFAVYPASETGIWVLAAFKNPKEWLNNDMRITSEFLSAREMAKTITEVSGKTVHVQEITPEQFETLRGNPFPVELHANMQILFHNHKAPFRDPEFARQLGVKTFRAWVKENVAKIAI